MPFDIYCKIIMKKNILLYGALLGLLLAAFKTVEYYFFSYRITLEAYLGIVAIAFLVIGLGVGWVLQRKSPPQHITQNPNSQIEATPILNDYTITGLSEREYEVLECLASGLSNQEIADKLFVSLSTIKTHVSNIYLKLDVKRRTQAITKAKELNIIL